jgi:hypothetical protein
MCNASANEKAVRATIKDTPLAALQISLDIFPFPLPACARWDIVQRASSY